ncbi:tetratricopeptide repeat protein [Blautia schinkii]|nr:tetratricopeptide repeat protein [Blautia schinkii]
MKKPKSKKKNKMFLFPMGIGIVCIIIIICVVVFMSPKSTRAGKLQEKLDLGSKYLETADYAKAEVAFNEALKIDEKSPDAAVGLAEVYNKQKKPEKALTMLKKASDNLSANTVRRNPQLWQQKMTAYSQVYDDTSQLFADSGNSAAAEEAKKGREQFNIYIINVIEDEQEKNDEYYAKQEPDEEEVDSEIGFLGDTSDQGSDGEVDEDGSLDGDEAADDVIDSENDVSPDGDAPSDSGVPSADEVPDGDEPSNGDEVPDGDMPSDSNLPVFNVVPEGDTAPDGNVDPEGNTTPDGNVNPDNSTTPDNNTAPDGQVSVDGEILPVPDTEQVVDSETEEGSEVLQEGTEPDIESGMPPSELLRNYASEVLLNEKPRVSASGTAIPYDYSNAASSVSTFNGTAGMYCGDLNGDGAEELLAITMSSGKLCFEIYKVENNSVVNSAVGSAERGFANAVESVSYTGTQECFIKDNGESVYVGIAENYFGADGGDGNASAYTAVNVYQVGSDGSAALISSASITNGSDPDTFMGNLAGCGISGTWISSPATALVGMDLASNPNQDMTGVPDPLRSGIASAESGVQDLVIVNGDMTAGSGQMACSIRDNTTFLN